jgi:hypothetical protein
MLEIQVEEGGDHGSLVYSAHPLWANFTKQTDKAQATNLE